MTAERVASIDYGPRFLHTPDINLLLENQPVTEHMLRATTIAAITAAIRVVELTGGTAEESNLDKDEKNRRVRIIDTDADTAFKAELARSTSVEYLGIDAEGGKEAHPDKLGEAMPLAVGVFGSGEIKATYVADVVEGTTAAAHGRPNAISIAGVSTRDGITKIPKRQNGQDAHYFRKLFAPGAFSNLLSLEMSAQENLERIATGSDIPPRNITVAVMDRKCNTTIIRQAHEFGADVELISAGDLAWCLRAIDSHPSNPIIMLGRGGAEEGSIAAVAAKARWATGQLRQVEEEEDVEAIDNGKIWTADEFVPGDPNQSMVIFSAITKNDHFGLSPVRQSGNNPNLFFVDSMLINSKGFTKIRNSAVQLVAQ